ncbi:MAG: tail fiber domain-containing protein [Acidobacteriota bacterium]
MRVTRWPLWLALALSLALLVPGFAAAEDVVKLDANGRTIYWIPLVEHVQQNLTLTGPAGFCDERTYDAYETPKLDTSELRDGAYKWRLVLAPEISREVKEMIEHARAKDIKNLDDLLLADGLVKEQIASGVFHIRNGEVILPDPNTTEDRLVDAPDKLDIVDQLANVPMKQVISGDLTVYNSICVGFDCLANESFGSDTFRLKENNLRIHFQDTSTAASFPTTDWRLVANSNLNGGASKFSIDDASAGRSVFTVEANAPSNALYVDDGGRVGVGTSTPVTEIHTTNGDSPTLRLEQNGSAGFAPQTWDVAGNETNFFIRDATNGSALPFRIRPGADSNALFIDTDNDIGMGTASPDASLEVERTDAQILVNDQNGSASGGATPRTLLRLSNLGKLDFRLEDRNSGNEWKFENDPGGFFISLDGSGATEFALANNGNLTIDGTLTENSDVTRKEGFQPVDPSQILAEVVELPITTWAYIDDPTVRHIGPMAQDFHTMFGFGGTDKGIQTRNLSSVALAAIQGLNEELEAKDQRIDELEQRLAALEALLLQAAAD